MSETTTPQRIYRLRDLPPLIGLKKPTIELLLQQGRFPRPFRISERAVGWTEADIVAWQRERTAQRVEHSAGAGRPRRQRIRLRARGDQS